MNKVILIGRLTADPEIGEKVAKYTLAVDRPFKAEGQPEADFIRCIVFGKSINFVSKYLHKGVKIAIEGSIRTSNYTKDDGAKVYKTEVVVDRHEFCEGKKANDGGSNSVPNSSIDDLARFGNVQFQEDKSDDELPF